MITATARPQRVLVVGLGFLGAAVGARLRSEGLGVVGLTPRPSSRTYDCAHSGVEVIYGRAEDPGILDDILDDIDHVVYTAGGLLPVEAADDPLRDATQMILPWITTLEALRSRPGIGVTLVSSGGTIYGNPTRIPVRESDPSAPISTYGVSRQACALYAGMYARTHGINVQVVRCANIYGPDQPRNRSQGVVAVFLHNIMNGIPVTVFGDGSAVRDYVYVDDVAEAITRLVCDRIPVDVVNIGSGRGHSILEILDALIEISGVDIEVIHAPERSHDVRAVVLDISRLRSLIDFEPVPIAEGLRRVWRHAAEDPIALVSGA